jgi:hypothetical protein
MRKKKYYILLEILVEYRNWKPKQVDNIKMDLKETG